MSALIDEAKKVSGLTLGLTSIGYDGEDFDNVTGLPKPRINVWPGNIVAIAEQCKRFGSAILETIKETDIRTSMGKIVICRVIRAGKVVLSGANKSSELRLVLDLLNKAADLIFVDGALNRIAPMVEADCLILVTGAARHTEIPHLALESLCMVDILSTPELKERGRVETVGSIFNQAGYRSFVEKLFAVDSVRINGVIGEKFLKELNSLSGELAGKRLIFEDPIKLFLTGEAVAVRKALKELSFASVDIGVKKAVKLLAMTVNPYYPKYCQGRAGYEEAYIDAEKLLEGVGGSIKIPCYDVVRHGAQDIFKMILTCQ